MTVFARRHLPWILFAVLIAVAAALFVAFQMRRIPTTGALRAKSIAALSLLTQPVDDKVVNAEEVRRGQYLVRLGDCMSCHLRPDGEAFAGGLGLNTPFGTIYSANITSDKETGIGDWTNDQFYRAMHDGRGVHGEHLYPAFPYPWFRQVSRADDDAILAFLKSTPPVHYTPPANKLPFPLNLRVAVSGWNLLFLKNDDIKSDPAQTAEWNRGAYLVNGLGHCGVCHTPKNILGADKFGQTFRGGELDHFVAPDLTGNTRTGLGQWSLDDITEYLATGRNARAGAGGPMAEVVTYSTSTLTPEDRHAIAVYLKTQAPSPTAQAPSPDASAMRRGAEIYSDACTGCHLGNGSGQPRVIPPLGENAIVQQANPAGVLHIVLAGSRIGATPSRPSAMTMPSFAWKLGDQEIADVTTFIRNSWGNVSAPISADDVRAARHDLNLQTVHLTANSGDQDQRQ
jgi:mono/diheme cytochrome c family protein